MLYLFLCHSSIEPRWYHSWPKSVRTAEFSMSCQCSASSHTREKMVKTGMHVNGDVFASVPLK